MIKLNNKTIIILAIFLAFTGYSYSISNTQIEKNSDYNISYPKDIGLVAYSQQRDKYPYLSKTHLSKTYPPKEWWGKKVTTKEVELEHKKQIEYQISNAKSNGIMIYDNKKSDFVMASSKELKEYINKLENQKKLIDPRWIKLKSLQQRGDIIRRYAAPPLTGSVGYILIRDNVIIYNYQVAIQ